jgi:LysM repeat protein
VVKKGDSLWSISQQFGVKMKPLANRNHLSDENPLSVGMTLLLR